MAMTYAQLLQLVQDFSDNQETSFVTNIPYFVKSAEIRINNAVQLPVLRKNVTGVMTASNKYITVPTDFLAPFSLAYSATVGGSQTFLLNKDVEFIREAYPDPVVEGAPAHYALFDSTSLIVGTTPDIAYPVELHYFAYPTSIVDAGTSWLGNNFETVLLYATLREANIYLKGEEDVTKNYENMYQEALMLLKGLGDGKDRRDSYRSGQNRGPVP